MPDFKKPQVLYEFPEGELVIDMTLIEKRKHWYNRKKGFLYIATNKGFYEMESK